MTFVLFAFGVVLVGASGRLLAQAIILPRLRLKQHLRALREYGFASAPDDDKSAAGGRLVTRVDRLAQRIGQLTMRHLPALTPLRRGELTAAGFYTVTTEAVHGYRAMGALALPGLIVMLQALAQRSVSMLTVLTVIVAAAGGWQLPAIVIKRRGTRRLAKMDNQLPDLIDLLIATVEAGMGVAGSLGLVASRFTGALGDELRVAVQQQTLGVSTEQALTDMGERCDTPSMRAFVRTVNRGESQGVSIGPILRELAVDMRRRRRQAARERMQKTPIKMLFPLMFLILPALMIVLMYPAVYSVLQNLGSL